MNQDVLDRLLMDRALGELPLDTNALLNAWLERDPASATKAAEIEATVALAKRTMQFRPNAKLPPLKLLPMTLPEVRHPGNRIGWAVGIAAAFVLGIGLGAWFQPPGPQLSVRPAMVEVVRSSDPNPSGFWSRVRWTNQLVRASSAEKTRLTWVSPVKEPVLNN